MGLLPRVTLSTYSVDGGVFISAICDIACDAFLEEYVTGYGGYVMRGIPHQTTVTLAARLPYQDSYPISVCVRTLEPTLITPRSER